MANQLKRKFIDANGQEVEKNRRSRNIGLSDDDKQGAFRYALELTISLCGVMNIPVVKLREVFPSVAIYNITYRTHQYARCVKNSRGVKSKKVIAMESNVQKFNIDGSDYTITTAQMLSTWTSVFERLKGAMNATEFIAKHHSVMCMLQLFRERVRELQIGPDVWIATKTEGNAIHRELQSFGIPNQYRHLVSGLSWDQNLRSTLAPFTTGLCQAAILSQMDSATNELYIGKHKIAVERAYNFIPQIKQVVNVVANNNAASNTQIIRRLAHLTAIHGDKHKRKNSIPFSFIFNTCVKVSKEEAMETTSAARAEPSIRYIFENLEKLSFSSKKSALLYNENVQGMIIPNVDKTAASQIIFHAYFGTQGEDFGILASMTNLRTWLRREEMPKEIFAKLKSGAIGTSVLNGVRIQIYSKNIVARQTDILAPGGSVMSNNPVFAGYRIRHISEEMMNFVKEGGLSSYDTIGNNVSSVVQYLDDMIRKVTSKIESLKRERVEVKFGASKWFYIEGATYAKDVDGTAYEGALTESGVCFWSA